MSARDLHILSVICANGLGHYMRSVGVLIRLQQLLPHLKISVVCESWQREISSDNDRIVRFWQGNNIEHIAGIIEPGVVWARNTNSYNDRRLTNWVDRLSRVDAVRQANVVISDNLTGVLSLRSDVILMGSFLWSEVLGKAYTNSASIKAFCDDEIRQLSQNKPPMLCTQQLATPHVLSHTSAVDMGFFCPDRMPAVTPDKAHTNKRCVALLGGATGQAAERLWELAYEFSTKDWIPFLSAQLWRSCPIEIQKKCSPCIPERGDLATCQLAVIRPGMGAITDCIAAGTPILALAESNQFEMNYLAHRLEQLGLGVAIGEAVSAAELSKFIEEGMSEAHLQRIRHTIGQQPRNGYHNAAQWLKKRLEESA